MESLKVWPPYWEHIFSGAKTFEFRKNDRDFKVGDLILLREWDYVGEGSTTKDYTGRDITAVITYIVHGGKFGIPEGYCIFGIEPQRATEG